MRLVPDEALAAVAIDTEAEGEPYPVKVGVAEVIRNRMAQKFYSDGTVAGTIWRKSQFSAFSLLPNANNIIRAFQIDDQAPAAMDCVKAWAAAQSGSASVGGALLFHSPTPVRPPWATDDKFICQLGSIRFYRA